MFLSPLYLDDDLIAIDKPPGLLTHPAEADGIADSAVAAVGRAIGDGHLGVHQRLDRDTSGLLLFARTPTADSGLARSFGARHVEKTYRAVVWGHPPRRDGALDAPLSAPGPDGRVVVARDGRGKDAVTAYRVVDWDAHAGISLIEAHPLTGRTHQVRVHLAALGCPVAGDGLYDPHHRAAPRLLLHASALSLPHPNGREHLTLGAPPPAQVAELSRASAVLQLTAELLVAGDAAPQKARAGAPGLGDLLALALHRRASFAADPGTTCYRLINGAADGLPGLTVERYGDVLSISYYDEDVRPDAPSAVVDLLMGMFSPRALYARVRPRRPARLEEGAVSTLVGAEPIAGTPTPELIVAEDGLSYLLRPASGLSSGLFLDMREARGWVRRHAAGRTVLNLFAYTCAFGVAGLVGGAVRVLNLDVARSALEWGKHNYHLNGLPVDDHDFVDGDVFDWLARFARRAQTFDIVIADPPSFATTRTSRFSARRDYRTLAAAAALAVAPSGLLVTCCNLASFPATEFRRVVRAGLADAGRHPTLLATSSEPAVDFPHPHGREPYLKIALYQL